MTDDNDTFEITYEKVKRVDNLKVFKYLSYVLTSFFFVVWILEFVLTFEIMSFIDLWNKFFYNPIMLFGILSLLPQVISPIGWKDTGIFGKILLLLYIFIMIIGFSNSLTILINLFICNCG